MWLHRLVLQQCGANLDTELLGTALAAAGDEQALRARGWGTVDAYRTLPPLPDELQRCRQFHHKHVAAIREKGRSPKSLALPIPLPDSTTPEEAAAWTDFALAVLNLSEFIYID